MLTTEADNSEVLDHAFETSIYPCQPSPDLIAFAQAQLAFRCLVGEKPGKVFHFQASQSKLCFFSKFVDSKATILRKLGKPTEIESDPLPDGTDPDRAGSMAKGKPILLEVQ